ncbi:MAG: diguanylate cyclase [Burkholderiaceae bacterium]|nr:diguanylate cyclase [Burkholderiaceae bacterium]
MAPAIKTNTWDQPANVGDLLLDAICVVDAQGRFLSVSAAGERIFGYTEREMLGRPMIELVYHEDRARTLQAAANIQAGNPELHFENRYVRKDGQLVHIMWSARWFEADQVRVAVARDVSQRKRIDSMQAALYAISEAAHSAEDMPALFRRIHQIIGGFMPALNFFVALYDERTQELSFPYYVDEYEGAPAPRNLDAAERCAEVIRTGKAVLFNPESKVFLQGYARHELDTDALNWLGMPLHTKKGVIGILVVQSYSADVQYTGKDIELLQFVSTQIALAIERKQMEIWLRHIAGHDPLTDLANRDLFYRRLQSALLWAQRNHSSLCLLYLDLDKFKQVNDTLGHSTGDLLLQETAVRLKQCVRDSDTVGRVGGDEFLVLLHNIEAPHDALLVAEKIRVALCQPFALAGQPVQVSPSIGVALFPEHGADHEQLIRSADAAMYEAKKEGGNQFRMAAAPAVAQPAEPARSRAPANRFTRDESE